MNTTSKGFRKYDPETDGNVDVAQWITDDSTYNMDLANKLFVEQDGKITKVEKEYKAADLAIEEKLNSKNTLDGKSQSNFNFIENKVVQDGIVLEKIYEPYVIIDSLKESYNVTSGNEYTISFIANMNTNNKDNGYKIICRLGTENNGNGYLGYNKKDNSFYVNYINVNPTALKMTSIVDMSIVGLYSYHVVWDANKNKIQLFIDGNLIAYANLELSRLKYIAPCYAISVDYSVSTPNNLYRFFVYDRILKQEEIQHNFQTLSNSKSIDSINIGDKNYILACDTDHVTDRTGRTQQKINQVFYSQNGKEFIADSTGKINVNNGLEGWVNKSEIQGQTVKNIAYIGTTKETNYFKTITHNNNWAQYDIPFIEIDRNKKYKIRYEVIENTLTVPFIFSSASNVQYVFMDYLFKVDAGIVGIFEKEFTPHATNSTSLLRMQVSNNVGTGKIVLRCTITEVEISSYIPFGLSSTQAIINNNGNSYPIYEPTIQGKTRILKALKGTQNWVEISPNEARDTVTYDYKFEDIISGLSGMFGKGDYIDLLKKELDAMTKPMKLNGNLSWEFSSEEANTIRYQVAISDPLGNDLNIICNNMATRTGTHGDYEYVFLSGGRLYVSILKSKGITSLSTFKTYMNNNPMDVIYITSNTKTTKLTDEQFKTYDKYKKLISLGGLPSSYDTAELKTDGSCVVTFDNKEVIITDKSNLAPYKESTDGTYIYIKCITVDAPKLDGEGISIFGYVGNDKYGMYYQNCKTRAIWTSTSGLYISIAKADLPTPDVDGFKEWLKTNPIVVRYKLLNPITTYIPKEIMPTILTNKINTLFVKSSVAPSLFTASLPTSDNIAKEFTLTPVNSWTGVAKANLLKNGDVELILNVVAPSTYNTHVATLPESCRPKANKTVWGTNGNAPVAISILTTGEVKCMTEITGSVELSTTYKLN